MKPSDKKLFNKELVALAVPLALQNLLNALVGASDALMLGRLTQDAIAAVSLANQISFVMSLFNGAVIGAVGVLVAQYWGKKDYTNAKRFLAMAVRYRHVDRGQFRCGHRGRFHSQKKRKAETVENYMLKKTCYIW